MQRRRRLPDQSAACKKTSPSRRLEGLERLRGAALDQQDEDGFECGAYRPLQIEGPPGRHEGV